MPHPQTHHHAPRISYPPAINTSRPYYDYNTHSQKTPNVALPYRTKEPWAETLLPPRQSRTMEEGPQLTPVGEKSLPAKCKLGAGALAYCPSMDLIALSTEDDELRVFRLNGQRVFGGSFKGDPFLGEREEDGEVRALEWKGNGEFVLTYAGTLIWFFRTLTLSRSSSCCRLWRWDCPYHQRVQRQNSAPLPGVSRAG